METNIKCHNENCILNNDSFSQCERFHLERLNECPIYKRLYVSGKKDLNQMLKNWGMDGTLSGSGNNLLKEIINQIREIQNGRP